MTAAPYKLVFWTAVRPLAAKATRLWNSLADFLTLGTIASPVKQTPATVASHSETPAASSVGPAPAPTPLPYPPVDPGIPSQPVGEILHTQKDLIDRIKLCYGVDHATFESDLIPLIRRYAEYVHLLPATPDNYFNAPGGLLRLGLEVAFYSLQGTDAHIFSGRSTISVRRQLEPRWRHATFIAGLCCELYRTLSHLIVTDEKGNQWQPYLQPLAHWLEQQSVQRYFLKWRVNCHENRCAGVFALPHIVPADILQHLATGNDVVVPHMMASISGMSLYREHNIVESLVRRSVALVVDRYLQASADRYGTPVLGSHLERYLVDALRRLLNSATSWIPNADKSWVWLGEDGLFILWPNAANAARDLLEADRLPGIPKAPETILEILVAAGVFEPQTPGQTTWQIVPPDSKMALEAVKLSYPAILLSSIAPEPKPLSMKLVRPVPEAPPKERAKASNPAEAVQHADKGRADTKQMALPMEQESETGSGESSATIATASAKAETVDTADKPSETEVKGQTPLALPFFKLDAPMRLNSVVRDALAQIVDTLNHQKGAAACTISSGVFIPLEEFGCRKVEVPFALRSLAESKMLVLFNGSQTLSRDFGGAAKVGLVIHPSFVAGLDVGNFDAP
jgi:conjugal transfer pilus assembly protein TraI